MVKPCVVAEEYIRVDARAPDDIRITGGYACALDDNLESRSEEISLRFDGRVFERLDTSNAEEPSDTAASGRPRDGYEGDWYQGDDQVFQRAGDEWLPVTLDIPKELREMPDGTVWVTASVRDDRCFGGGNAFGTLLFSSVPPPSSPAPCDIWDHLRCISENDSCDD
jgi:hypothetical protein